MLLRFGERYQHLIQAGSSACRSHQDQSIRARTGKALPPWCAVALAFFFFGAHSAYGADATPEVPENPGQVKRPNWALQITPYMWASSLDGHVSPFQRGPTIAVEKSFSDIMGDLNFGGFVNVWGRYDRFVLSGDIMYVDTTDGHNAGPLPAFRIPGVGIVPPGGNIDAKVNTKQLTATLMGGYRVIDTPQFTLDAVGGARFWHISNDVKLT